MPADEHLGIQFEYDSPNWRTADAHRIRALSGSHRFEAGSLRWDAEGIRGVDVTKEYRRLGLAAEMLKRAQQLAGESEDIPEPKHSEIRTPSGDKWARAVGGELPPRKRD
jgi:GNAT superfamily N-acetyltransferase